VRILIPEMRLQTSRQPAQFAQILTFQAMVHGLDARASMTTQLLPPHSQQPANAKMNITTSKGVSRKGIATV